MYNYFLGNEQNKFNYIIFPQLTKNYRNKYLIIK